MRTKKQTYSRRSNQTRGNNKPIYYNTAPPKGEGNIAIIPGIL